MWDESKSTGRFFAEQEGFIFGSIAYDMPEDIERALGAWLRLGTAAAASRETGIPGRTIRSWRALHPERFVEHQERFGRELSALREEIGQQAAEGVQEAVLVARRV